MSGPPRKQGASTARPGEGATGKDEVRLSAVADQVGNLSSTPERAAKIAELAKVVQSGQYNPQPEKSPIRSSRTCCPVLDRRSSSKF